MAALVVPSAVLVRLIYTYAGSPHMVNVLGGRKVSASTIDQGLANTLGGAIKAAYTSSGLNALIGGNVHLQNIGVRDISAPNKPEFLDSAAPVPGGTSANLLPPQVALCATLRTDSAGKSYRGRFYQGGFTVSSNMPDGTASAASGTALANFLNAIDTAMAASGLNLAVVSRKLLVATDTTLVQVRDLVWDTVRKRATAGI